MTKFFQILTAFLFLCATAAYAQQSAAVPAAKPGATSAANLAVAGKPAAAPAPVLPTLTPEEMNRPFEGSFFLSPLEIAAIQKALSGQGVMKPQTLAEEAAPIIPARRVIRVSGVLYRSPQNWVVWMNNQKVTPENLLPEIVDISVKDSSKVSLEWYDAGLNQVLSITLRPHQTYDITTGVLLPK